MGIFHNSLLSRFFPEIDWQELDGDGYQSILAQLRVSGQHNSGTADYIRKHRVRLGFHAQDNSGGGWTLLRNITLTPGTNPSDRYNLSLITHEVFHLQQSVLTRLSVSGELLAWQYQAEQYRETFGKGLGEVGEAYPGTQAQWDELMKLSPASRDDLRKAQGTMQQISRGYRSDCLPLYPLTREIWYFLRQGNLRECFDAVKNLVTCR